MITAAINRFFRYLEVFLKVICLSLILSLALLTFVKVIFRYVLGSPIIWSDEIIVLMILVLTYFGAALAANERAHINVDLLESLFSKLGDLWLKIYHLILDIIFLFVMTIVIIYGIKISFFSLDQSTEILMISYFWVYLMLPLAVLFIMLMIFKRMWEEFLNSSAGKAGMGGNK
jgi:TRAP-type transport system small permease protein